VILDAIVYESMFADDHDGPSGQCLGLERWTIDPRKLTVERTTIDATPQEFPRTDERRLGQPHRFVWAAGLPKSDAAYLGETFLHKHDLETGRRELHDFGRGRSPGEFVFVAAREESAEGEGWLIGLVVDMPDGQWQLSTHWGHGRATSNLLLCPSSKDRPSAADHISKSHSVVIAAQTSMHAATRANGNFVPRHSVKALQSCWVVTHIRLSTIINFPFIELMPGRV